MLNLRIPGPTPCPSPVLQAQTKPMINHRGKEFGEIITRVTAKLKELFQTQGDLLLLTASGTGAMETAVVNTLSPEDKVLALTNGVFGERFAQIAKIFGANVRRLDFPWGKAIDPAAVRAALASDVAIKAVLVVHNETSTGVTNDLETISAMVKEFEKLLLVDAISSIGAIALPVDSWRCDMVASAAQKGWMTPPGLAMVSVSHQAWEAIDQARMPRFYWDLTKAKNFLERAQTPWTPAVSTFYALDKALELMAQEGLSAIVARHERVGALTRKGVKELGLSLFAEEAFASNTVTAVAAPVGVEVGKLLRILREDYGVVLSGGQQSLEGKIFRIGHLGYIYEADIEEVLKALEKALTRVGFSGAKEARIPSA
ncbi:MAG: alanine--glyoxylate aminotransferase family protein [Chloroflexi bacterium]|nr:alanine--glyoxylate aminotransferase family protein [Chloroflexota bacterium]